MRLLPNQEILYCGLKIPVEEMGVKKAYRNIKVESFADDFYSNLLDWSKEIIYYAIENRIYSYNFFTEKTEEIYKSSTAITAVKHNRKREKLCVGSSSGMVFYVDTVEGNSSSNRREGKEKRQMAHRSRIGVMKNYGDCLVTGSRDRKTKVIDLRTQGIATVINSHTQEICGITIKKSLLATGGNDNKVFVYDLRNSQPLATLTEHRAAVKALSWAPHSSLLATGGGSADKTMKVYDVSKKESLVKSIDFDSQLTNIKWLSKGPSSSLVLSTFGYSDDDIKLLKDFKVQQHFKGHKNRVIHFSVSEDETYFATGSGDGTIKIWEIGGDISEEIRIR